MAYNESKGNDPHLCAQGATGLYDCLDDQISLDEAERNMS